MLEIIQHVVIIFTLTMEIFILKLEEVEENLMPQLLLKEQYLESFMIKIMELLVFRLMGFYKGVICFLKKKKKCKEIK